MPNFKKIEVEAGQVHSSPISLLEQADAIEFDLDDVQVTIPNDEGSRHFVTIQPGSLARESTPDEPYVGRVTARVTYVDPDTDDIFGFPGSFAGALDKDGEEQLIETFGFAHYDFETADGEKLVVIEDLSEIELPLIEYVLPNRATDEEIGLWGFDEDEGIWKEETAVSPATVVDGVFAARAECRTSPGGTQMCAFDSGVA